MSEFDDVRCAHRQRREARRSKKTATLSGLKVLFDRRVGVLPVELVEREEPNRRGVRDASRRP
jgi:hypothetical protein